MKITDPGNITCDCGNDELVFVRTLYFPNIFLILCRKCGSKGMVELDPKSLRSIRMPKEEVKSERPD